MEKENQSKILLVIKVITLYLCITLFSFLVINLINNYVLVSSFLKYGLPFIIALNLLLITYLIKPLFNKVIINKINRFIKLNLLDLIFLFISISLFILSITHYKTLTNIKFDSMLSYSWIILGLSITIFIFGFVLVDSYLGDKTPPKTKKVNINNFYEVKRYLNEKQIYEDKINDMYFPITNLLINAIINIVATGFIIFSNSNNTDIKKIIIILSLILSVNTFLSLITNVCIPFIKEKSKVNKENKNQNTKINNMYLEFLKQKEKENFNTYIKSKVIETLNIKQKIENNEIVEIDKYISNINVDEIINNITNYNKYFKETNMDINILKTNLEYIMTYILERNKDE